MSQEKEAAQIKQIEAKTEVLKAEARLFNAQAEETESRTKKLGT